MFERRSNEEADGESMMIGSGRLPEGLLLRSAGEMVVNTGVGPDGRVVVRFKNISVYFLTWEKS